ncbi:MAG: hypothetical protein Q8P13_00295 [bacterium]|nr:hypothetical protein [bacterium]
MPKVSATKLIDEAFLPVVLVFGSKWAGLLLTSLFLPSGWEFSFQEFSLATPFLRFTDPGALAFATTASSLLTFLVLGVCFGWALFRAHEFHLTHLHPNKAKRLTVKNLDGLFIDSHELYHQAVVWLVLLIYLSIEGCLNFLSGNISLFILSLEIGTAISFVYLLFDDLAREVESFRPQVEGR